MNARSLKLWLHLFALLSVTACGGNAGAPNQPPTASFTATPSEGAAPLEVLFDASASADPDGSITAYAWDFRDGNAGAGRTTRHTFTAPGNYEVKLTVTDDGGKTGETTRTVAVTASNGNDGDNRAPLARDDLAVTNLGRPVTINVLANDEDPDGDPLTVTVVSNPANGSAAINEGATVTYTPNEGFVGTDAFTYEIADGRGGAATATVTVQVSAFNEVHYLPGMRTLVYHQGRFYHVYYDDSSGDPDVYLRSSDDGVSWSRVRVSDGVPGASEGIAGLAVWEEDGGTHVAVSWQDGRGERQ